MSPFQERLELHYLPQPSRPLRRNSLLINLRRPHSSHVGKHSVAGDESKQNTHLRHLYNPSSSSSANNTHRANIEERDTMFGPARLQTDRLGTESWDSQWGSVGQNAQISQLGARPFCAMRQSAGHQRTATEDFRRPAPMQLRGRSNTTTSIDFPAQRSPSTSNEPSERPPPEHRSSSFATQPRYERSGSLGKTLRTKASRFLRRQDSNENLTSLHIIDYSNDTEASSGEATSSAARSPNRPSRLTKRPPSQAATEEIPFRWHISEPFNFQHLTHTEHNQFQSMQEAPAEEFVTEFSVMRASQAPGRELRGIRAETISRQDVPTDKPWPPRTLTSLVTGRYSPRRPSHGSEALSPRSRSPWLHSRAGSFAENPNASPIDSTTIGHNPLQASRYDCDQHLPYNKPKLNPLPANGSLSPMDRRDSALPNIPDDACFPHAVTTPNNAALPLKPPAFDFSPELSRVVEEDERLEAARNAANRSSRPGSMAHSSSLRQIKSVPSIRQPSTQPSVIESTSDSLRAREQSTTLGHALQLDFDDYEEPWAVPAPICRRISTTTKGTENDWEDLVDWCYEHNAEADDNFDFARAPSLDTPRKQTTKGRTNPPAQQQAAIEARAILYSQPNGPSDFTRQIKSTTPSHTLHRLKTDALNLPPALSPHSSFDSVSEAVTPQSANDIAHHRRTISLQKVPNFSKPSVYIPMQVANDITSQDLYGASAHESVHCDAFHFTRDGRFNLNSSSSSQSSRSPVSKSSSQESFWIRRHRPNESQSSIADSASESVYREQSDCTAENSGEVSSPPSREDSGSGRRNEANLVRDVAQKSLIARLQAGTLQDATDAQCPLPLHPALRQDATASDVPKPLAQTTRPQATRMRSASSVSPARTTHASSAGVSRASYAYYPSNHHR